MIGSIPQDWPAPAAPKPIVIIGAGGIVRDAHLPAYARAGLPVAAVADIDRGRAAALARDHGIGSVHDGAAAAAAAHGTAAVYDIAVPPQAICAILPELPEGAAVLIQKPMGADLGQARAIRDICRDRRLKAAVNFQLRFAPMMMALRGAIDRGLLGELVEIEVHLNVFTPWHLFPFLMAMERVEILVHSIHYLDTIRALAGDPRGVLARSLGDPRAPGVRQTRTSLILDYDGPLRAVMSINHNHPHGPRFQRAWFRLEGSEGAAMAKLGVIHDYPGGEPDELWFCPRGGAWAGVPLTGSWFPEAFMGPMRNLQRFAAGEDDRLFSGVEDAFRTMALVEAAFASMQVPGVAPEYD